MGRCLAACGWRLTRQEDEWAAGRQELQGQRFPFQHINVGLVPPTRSRTLGGEEEALTCKGHQETEMRQPGGAACLSRPCPRGEGMLGLLSQACTAWAR